jgi:hypothetical protein
MLACAQRCVRRDREGRRAEAVVVSVGPLYHRALLTSSFDHAKILTFSSSCVRCCCHLGNGLAEVLLLDGGHTHTQYKQQG